MTQPGFSRIETLYTRALRLLGIVSPGNVLLDAPNQVQNVQMVADVSDVTIPHSNPLFGASATVAGVALELQIMSLEATSRPLRIWTLFIGAGTTVELYTTTDNIITSAEVAFNAFPLGPVGQAAASTARTQTAITRIGGVLNSALPAGINDLGTFIPELVQWNTGNRRGMLIAPGSIFTILNHTIAETLTAGFIWEEVPGQEEISQVGFPETV